MQRFNTGGTAATGAAATGTDMLRAEESSLSSWAGPYVTDMLGRGQALATQMPYTPYTGPLTPGASNLQTQAFQGLGSLNMPTADMGAFNPQSFTGAGYAAPTAQQVVDGETGTYTPASGDVLQQYMTPYLQGALQPQYDAANRQALISAQNLQSQYGKAGAYGGSRQGVAEAELQRGLLDRMSGITGQGYQDAFTAAQNQFNTEQDRQMTAQQRTNQYGMDVLDAQQAGGATQRGVEGQGIAADYAQFTEERDYPFKQVQYQQSLLEGLPIGQTSRDFVDPSSSSEALGILGLLNELYAEYKKKD